MNMNEITLKVGGMSCMGCVNSVRNLLSALPGVENVSVDLANGQASLRYDPEKITVETLKTTILDGGYTVSDT